MSAAAAAVLVPMIAALIAGFFGSPIRGAYANLGICCVLLVIAMLVFFSPGRGVVQADPLGMIFGLLTAFVALATAINNIAFVRAEPSRMTARNWRIYHAMSQLVLGATLLGLYADSIGLLWAAMEVAMIAAAVGLGLPRNATALAAAWKYFVLGSVGIVLALFGTLVIYLAAQPALGPGLPALSFTALAAHAPQLDGRLLTLAFLFLLFGYGTQAALAPLTTSLNGLVLNVALLAILRFRHLLQANFASGGGAMPPGPFLLTLGLAALLLAAFSLSCKRDARRFFGITPFVHSGIAVFAFGIGGAAAIFGGLLHMLLHTLIKSALFQALTRTAALQTSKPLAWMLGASVFALTGLPPSGLFTSEFLIVSQTIQREPALSLPLGLGLAISAIAIIRRIGPILFNPPPRNTTAVRANTSIITIGLQLLLVLILAFAMPAPLVRMLSQIAGVLQ